MWGSSGVQKTSNQSVIPVAFYHAAMSRALKKTFVTV